MDLSVNSQNHQILQYLQSLDKRIAQIEARLNIETEPSKNQIEQEPIPSPTIVDSSDILELKIGQLWFAKAGIVVLAIGIVLALTFPYKNFPPLLPSTIGYFLVGGILILSHLFRNSFILISRYLFGGGLLLFYFATLRLHFFSTQAVISDKNFLIILLLVVVLCNLFWSIKRKSVYLSGISLTLGFITAIISEQPLTLFVLIAFFSACAVYLKLKFHWQNILVYGIILAYFTHFIWFINNPFLGNQVQLVSSPEFNLPFILVYSIIFLWGNLLRDRKIPEDSLDNSVSFLNSVGGFTLFLLISATMFQAHLFIFHIITSILFIGISILFWVRDRSKYSTFFYAIVGYSALSVAIIAQFPKPDFFIWLCWQSLLVVSTAIWFRSKIIVLANFIIYLIIFIAYLITAGKADLISLSFVIVSLVSARIMNWQKDRLKLKTDYMRNAYLTTAFIIFPYALYDAVPTGYVAFAWVGIALFYYSLSILLKNKKYRLMALFTLLLTVVYIFIVGTVKLEPTFRIVSFLVLGVVLLIVSLVYTKHRTKSVTSDVSS